MRRSVAAVLLLLLGAAVGPSCRGAGVGPPAPEASEPAVLPDGVVVERIVVGWGRANCYVVSRPPSRGAVVIDPGADAGRILARLEARGLVCREIALTHGHADHVGAASELSERTGAPIRRHSRAAGPNPEVAEPGRARPPLLPLAERSTVGSGFLDLEVLHTPGHSPGSVCLHRPGLLFTGDLLFAGSVGRTDLPGGDAGALERSLHVRLAHLPDDTRVFPGHGGTTTLGRERRTNPYLNAR